MPNTRKKLLKFVPGHYVARRVGELDTEKLPLFIEPKLHSPGNAVKDFGLADHIRETVVAKI